MSWKIGITVALLNGIVTALVTAPVADALMGMHGVSDFEGERGMALVFLFIPAGFFGGALLGLVGPGWCAPVRGRSSGRQRGCPCCWAR